MKKFYTKILFAIGQIPCKGGGNCNIRLLLIPLLSCLFTPNLIFAQNQQRPQTYVVQGVVLDQIGQPFAGVSVTVPKTTNGTTTGVKGDFRIMVPRGLDSLRFSFIGYKTLTIHVRDAGLVRMQEDIASVGEVVVTGIYTRKAESYTGSATTISGKDLMRVGNQNALESLKALDPTIYMPANLTMGSDPNTLPSLSMRGTSSFPLETSSTSFRSNYQNQPNQPLFILDGFETTLESVMDMDMNRIESMTILKDAAAKALYGSKAANGVIVIETKRLMGNEQRVTYNGSVTFEMPDLTSYDLCNAMEKLEAERLAGVYTVRDNISGAAENQVELWQLYNSRRKLALEGLDTYWLSKPLRTAVGHKHNINVEVGDSQSLRAIMDFTYNNVPGVMKGSDRTNIQGSVNLSYRTKKVIFRNIMSVTSNKSYDSPYGTFSDYAKMNPFWQATDENGNVLRFAELSSNMFDGYGTSQDVPNPMYDAEIGTEFVSSYLNFTNNFYAEWNILPELKATGRVGISAQRSTSEDFYPALHSRFSTVLEQNNPLRGQYDYQSGKRSSISGDLNFNYNKSFGKHNLFANVGGTLSETIYSDTQMSARGFPNSTVSDISAARDYAEGKPVSIASTNREVRVLLAAAYDYDDRYLLDLTYSANASSLYGSDNRWASNWSVGIGWNLHNESFLENYDFIKQLKLRGSIGLTGNQNFSTSAAIATYNYYTDYSYLYQSGAYLAQMPNSALKWEQKLDYNIGFDFRVSKLNLTFDYYSSDTKNMLTSVSIAPSTGFDKVQSNLGLVRNQGVELQANYTVWQHKDGFVNLYGSFVTNKNKIIRLSESMRTYNEQNRKLAEESGTTAPVAIYEDGNSMTAIWAVPSAGIDPQTGQEVFIQKDGSLTYTYNSANLVVAGDNTPKYRGNFGFSAEYKGVGLSALLSYQTGYQMYNTTLLERVENVDINYNVDRRVLLGRWNTPGMITQFKDVRDQRQTRATTRFVQDASELTFSSLSMYYEFPTKMISKIGMQRLRLSFYMNDLATWSSIKIERGTTYPFARTMSFSLTATF